MAGAVPLGRWAGVPIGAHWSTAAILVLIAWLCAGYVLPTSAAGHSRLAYWLVAVATAVAFLGTLLLHELAHAVVARHYGMPVRSITLWMLGGLTDLDGEPPTPRADAWIAAVGPLVSLGIGLVGGGLVAATGTGGMLGAAVFWLAEVNVLLGVFNLLPGLPFDGGRLLRALLWRRYGDQARAGETAARAGRGVGMALAGLGLLELLLGGVGGLWLALIGWFVYSSADAERYSAGLAQLSHVTVGQIMTPVPFAAPQWWTAQQLVDELWTKQRPWTVLPVVDFAGDLAGVITLAALRRVPATERGTVRVRDLAARGPAPVALPPAAPAAECLPALRRRAVIVVVDARRPVGVVTASDVMQAVQLAGLHIDRSRSDEQHPTSA